MPPPHFLIPGLLLAASAAAADFARDVRPVLENFCTDCHDDGEKPKGGLNLERFTSDAAAMEDRAAWKRVFDQIEAGQMPPPKKDAQPSAAERAALMTYAANLLARPDPVLGTRDPGRPVLRRLTRLEYNNTIRDLLGLDTDVFMFPERLPFRNKDYFQPAAGSLGSQVSVQLVEYGGKMPTLLPLAGLPDDGRAEHGYRNRGDVMNFSPLVLEQYVALAAGIANHPDLHQRSPEFAGLLGVEYRPRIVPADAKLAGARKDPVSPATGVYAPNAPKLTRAAGSADNVEARFREEIAEAFSEGRGGVFDVAANAANATVPGKGAVLRVPFGDDGSKTLLVNPDADLWLASFGTADETSGALLITNKVKGEKRFELTLKVENGDADEGIQRLGVCVLGRSAQSGTVTLAARFSDDTETTLSAEIMEGAKGTTFFSFAAVPGEHVKSLTVDGSKFSGDYVLLDDIGFITNGRAIPNARPPSAVAPEKPAPPAPKPQLLAQPAPMPVAPPLPPAERLANFVSRALRRPATDEERARFQALFDAAKKSGKSESDAMRAAVQAVLSSPGFLFLAEPLRAEAGKIRALDGWEIASRLGYFLWASAPDAELLDAARKGELSTPAGITAQTRRMLRDPKARELSESFAFQWLRLDQLYTAKPDRELFKDFYTGPQGKDTAHGAMLVEALLLFETVLIEDRSVLEFIGADYSWMNPRLQRLYGLDAPAPGATAADAAMTAGTREVKQYEKDANNRWTRHRLPDARRGGFLTMGGPLTVTSLPFRTSPVKRGAWLLETVFNRPPVEPKVAFALKDDSREAVHAGTVRERFEQHRNDPNCFSCHIRLDPPGFALEAFSPIGQWRERDGESAVDASGEWAGRKFTGPDGFKAILVEKPGEFVRGFIEHMLSYALGRKLEHYDQPAVAEIQRAVERDGFKFSSVVAGIVTSHPFRNIRNAAVNTATR